MSAQTLKTVLAIASEMFDREVAADDGFFRIGGDSVHAIEFAMRVERHLDIEVDPVLVIGSPDFAALAAELGA